MNLMEKMGLQGTMESLPIPKAPGKDVLATAISATIDPTPQVLRPVRPSGKGFKVPSDLTPNGRYVLEGIFACFLKQGFIKEGSVSELLRGFVDYSGWPAERVAYGLVDLRRAGYISFVAPDNITVDEHCTKLSECWVHYEPKLLELVEG